ncbi:histidine kinase/DNA gyrase B/HSP90-like ATPase [Desulfobotulus alkaliphilus]|uniref:histidine kinase n=1 Tax=Desulfobotulus alkaliphilus TaxID=622671 RepID=A0A562RJY7_9BACT|nr:PAS domain-containing sensor histidine kinase [Desulfobotulus alkaliphilus]TWI68894.1 histidine kinase/DNA gyrase B/HSP90-like ATPase [Desulfobotulus alkaliphilus]
MALSIMWIPKDKQHIPLLSSFLEGKEVALHVYPPGSAEPFTWDADLVIWQMPSDPVLAQALQGRVRSLSGHCNLVILGEPEQEEAMLGCMDLGAVDLLFLPLKPWEIHALLRRYLQRVKNAQELLRMERFFHNAPCYITIQGKECSVRAVNRRFQKDFGVKAGLPCYMVYRDDPQVRSAPCPSCPLKKTIQDGIPHQSEMLMINRKGEEMRLLVWTAPVYDESGNFQEIMMVSTDITNFYREREHLSHLGLMITTLSHSIKGLLTGMDGGLYLMSSGFRKNRIEDMEEGFEAVKHITGRLRSLVLDILLYAKERPMDWERMDAMSFLEDVFQTMAPRIRIQGISFVSYFDSGLDFFDVDAGIFRTALINLLENALDACMADTTKENHRIEMHGKESGDGSEIFIEIRDTGIGMDEETRRRMFTIFFSSKGRSGTGLGLFITSRIIHQHGGDIRVVSAPGEGAVFTLRIPKTRRQDAEETEGIPRNHV